MEFGRRAFLQFAAGAVGGTLLTPIPWKLADDSAIWSQNWSWRPSPERGQVTKVPTTCLLCEGGCGIQAHLVNGHRAIYLEGNADHPVNHGGVCPLCASGLQFLYAPYRIAQPMKQTKQRGDADGFKAITWEEAIAELGGVLSQLRSDGMTHSVACITGRPQSSMYNLWRQFFTAYGSHNLYHMPRQADSLKLAATLTMGQEAPFAFSLEQASYVLSFGANLLEGWGTPGRVQNMYGRWHDEKRGTGTAKLVQVDSRCSITATKAEKWIPVKPGSEAALALGIAHVMIRENLYDSGFVNNYVFGFEDWNDINGNKRMGFKNLVLSAYSPERVAELTGLETVRIQELAKEFANLKNAVAVWGDNQGNLPNNIYHDLSFFALNVLKGNLSPGGTMTVVAPVPLGGLPRVQIDTAAQRGLAQPRLDLVQAKNLAVPGNGVYAFLDALANNVGYPVKVLMIHEANPAYSLPDNQLVRSALKNAGKVVSFSSFMDETALQADLILPNHTALERYDDVIGLPWTPAAFYAVASPVLRPQLDTKHTGDILIEVGKQVGNSVAAALPWENYEGYLKERVKQLAASGQGAVAEQGAAEPWKLQPGQAPQVNYKDENDLWDKLTSGKCWYGAPVDAARGFLTDSGKCELALQMLQKRGVIVEDDQIYLPHFAPLSPSGEKSEFPLLLVGYQLMSLSNGYLANPPFMMKTLSDKLLKGADLFVQVNPGTAQTLGMNEGDRAVLKTPQGQIPVRIHLFHGAQPDVVFVPQGLGHKAQDEYIKDKGANANDVIEVQMDPITGLGTVWATRAQLHRA